MSDQDAPTDRESEDGVSDGSLSDRQRSSKSVPYETIFEAVDDAVFIVDVERDGEGDSFRFLRNNQAHETLTGIRTEEFGGEPISDVLAEEESADIEARYRQCVEEREPVEYEKARSHPTGRVEWHTKLTPVVEDGTVTTLVGVARDITEQRERERERIEQQGRLRAVFDDAPDGIAVHDEKGNVLEVNDRLVEMLGYTRQELSSMNVLDFEVGIAQEVLRDRWNSLETGETRKVEIEGRHRRNDGSTYPVDVWVSRLSTDTTTGDQFVAIVRDISERKRYERELREREEKYRSLFSESRDALMLLDRDEFIECNQAALDLFAVDSPERLAEYTPWDLSPPTQPDGRPSEEAATAHLEQAMREGEAVFEWVHQRTDGATFTAEVKLSRFELGSERLLQALVRDVTERKARERELERYETFVESTSDIITLIDTEARIEFVSPTVERLLGWTPDELDGENTLAYLHPDDRDEQRQALDELVEEPGRETVLEFRFQSRDGDYVWIEATARNMLDDPDVDAILLSGRDVSEQKEFEHQLRAERDFLDRVVESVPFPFYVLDIDDYTVEHANSEAIVETGQTCYEVTHGRDLPCDEGENPIACPIAEIRETEERTVVEHVHYDDEGRERIFQVHSAPIFDDGEVVQIAESNVDITERVMYERQLEEQRDNLEILNQVVRHDIRNDLQLIQAYAELLESKLEGDSGEHLAKILESTESAVDLTMTARDLAEVMLKSDAENQRLSLADALERQIEEVRSTHSNAAVTVDGTIPQLTVRADEMLSSVFRNLLKNAVQHNDQEVPEVTVGVQEGEEYVEVRVADNGPGVPDGQKDEIFGRGQKGLESEGTGLGLYLVRTLVDEYGGEVWVEDRDAAASNPELEDDSDGRDGATFVVRLPIAE